MSTNPFNSRRNPFAQKEIGILILILIASLADGMVRKALGSSAKKDVGDEVAPGVFELGSIKNNDITESSGLVASRRNPGVFWTHNDSGNAPVLFAITRTGQSVAQYKIHGVDVADWEDIALDHAGNLYIADIGDNARDREEIVIHRLREPNTRRKPDALTVTKSWHVRYPDAPFDAESFFVSGNYGYVISKDLATNGAPLYRFPLLVRPTDTMVLEPYGVLPVEFEPTGADLSGDRRRLAVITDNGAYVFSARRNVLESNGYVSQFVAFDHNTMEGITLTKQGAVVSSEDGKLFLFNAPLFQTK